MGRPIRNTDPKLIRLVTIRTSEARLFLTPDEELNQIVGGVLAKYREKFEIELFAYVVLGNHIHLLLRAPKGNAWLFGQNVFREVAKRVNWKLGRSGFFWGRRYDEQITVEDSDALAALLYVATNPVKHGLVQDSRDWPGLCCHQHLLDEKPRVYKFTDYTAYKKAKKLAKATGKKVRIADFQTPYKLLLTPLPQFAELSQGKRVKEMSLLLNGKLDELHKERGNKPYLGRKAVRQQNPNAVPENVSRSPRPLCYTKSLEGKRQYMEWYFGWLEWYRAASRDYRRGFLGVEFPPHSLRPPLHYAILAD